MKKKLLLIIMMFFAVTAVSAQGYKVFSLGLKAGANMSNIDGLANIKTTLKTGFTGGLSFEFRPVKFLGLSVDALYSGDGFTTEPIQFENLTAKVEAKLGYIDLPIMARVYLLGGLSVNAGIMPSFLVSSNIQVGGSTDKDFLETNTSAFSIPVGISYKFGFGLLIEGRYNIALSDLNKAMNTNFGNKQYNLKREAFSIMLGFGF